MKKMNRHSSKTKQKSTKRTYTLIGIVLLVVALLIAGILLYRNNNQQDAKITSTKPESSNFSTTPLDATQTNEPNNDRKNSDTVSSTLENTSTPSSTSAVRVTITRVSTNPSKVATLVNGATSGTCSLLATKSGQQNVTASSTVALNTNTYQYDCGQFGITANQFDGGGWTITVSVDSPSGKATSEAWQL